MGERIREGQILSCRQFQWNEGAVCGKRHAGTFRPDCLVWTGSLQFHLVRQSRCNLGASGLDVIEIDAASNSGVDGVRSLIEKVKYAPIKGRYKVYIIDEVHMMTENAFNALLKTLEEPPEYVVFILCTTEPYQIIPTILSRCQRYDFSKISDESLSKLIIRVLNNEGITYDEGVVESIVEIASGGARDALSLLDQLIAFSGNHISLKNIEKVFGLTNIEEKINLLKFLLLVTTSYIASVMPTKKGYFTWVI